MRPTRIWEDARRRYAECGDDELIPSVDPARDVESARRLGKRRLGDMLIRKRHYAAKSLAKARDAQVFEALTLTLRSSKDLGCAACV